MKKHVWRPLWVVVALVLLILLFRMLYVPEDFGAHERGYTFGFHRLGNEQEWKDFPAQYRGSETCQTCHDERYQEVMQAQHAMIPCENCHGAAFEHPENPERLAIDRNRDLCLRCHSRLFMPSSGRDDLPGIDPAGHNPGIECSDCHNPHDPSLEGM